MPTVITESEEYNIGLLSGATEEEHYDALFWSRFMGFVEPSNVPGEEVPPMAPIMMKREFGTEGMTTMKVPKYRRLTEDFVYGDTPVKNTGEKQKINYQQIRINQRRKAVQPPTRMGEQRIKRLDLINRAKPQLSRILPEHTEVMVNSAIYEGFSRNVTATAANGGYAQTKYYHPNFYTIKNGQVTWSATAVTYISNIHTAIQAMAGASDDKFNSTALYGMASEMIKLKIQPINLGGMPFWPLLIHVNQWRQLMQDGEFRADLRSAAPRDVIGNPIFQGAAPRHYFAGFLIFVRNSVWGISTTASALTFGATNPLVSFDTYDHKVAIAFGMGFLYGGWAFGPHFTTMEDDHENWKEVGITVIDGYSRDDSPDSTSSPTEAVNQGSALLASYSPNGWLS